MKRGLKTWMLVYVGFAMALATANSAPAHDTNAALVSPGSLPTDISADQAFFRPADEQSVRNDI
jgi:hypothetical protein